MTTYYVDITTSAVAGFEGSGTVYSISAVNRNGGEKLTSGDKLDVVQGDTIEFKWKSNGGNAAHATDVLLQEFRSAVWTSTANIRFTAVGQTARKYVKSSGELGTEDITMQATLYTGTLTDVYFNVLSNSDTTPDNFTLGPTQSNLYPNADYFPPAIKITGINTSTSVSCSGTGFSFRVGNSSTYVTSASINNNTWIHPRFIAPNAWSRATSVSLTVGTMTRSVTLTTISGDDVERIPFPHTKADKFGLREIGEFYGIADYLNPTNLNFSDYWKGGNAVPDISPENDGIASAGGKLSMAAFEGSATTLYFSRYPANKADYADSSSGSVQVRATWNVRTDYDAGYGTFIENIVDVRYMVVTNGSRPSIFEIYPNNADGVWSNWFRITAYDELQVSMTGGQNTEYNVHGTIYIQLRHPTDTSSLYVVQASANFTLSISGP
jgi:hypothetical protein